MALSVDGDVRYRDLERATALLLRNKACMRIWISKVLSTEVACRQTHSNLFLVPKHPTKILHT